MTKGFSLWRQFAVIVATSLFMTFLAPFGTALAGVPVRLAYWACLMSAGTILSNLMARYALKSVLFERRPWVWAALVTGCITPPLTLIAWCVTGLLFLGAVRLTDLPTYLAPVVVISAGMLALTVLTQRQPYVTLAERPAVRNGPRFQARLQDKLRAADLLAVQAEDHYLRVYTSDGQDLILMRLSDALAELHGVEGAQVHRSWWVSRSAVVGAAPRRSGAALTLKDGTIAPVSRTYAQALKRAGWY